MGFEAIQGGSYEWALRTKTDFLVMCQLFMFQPVTNSETLCVTLITDLTLAMLLQPVSAHEHSRLRPEAALFTREGARMDQVSVSFELRFDGCLKIT